MDAFWSWNGWNMLSVIVQVVVFLPALAMIFYQIKKDKRALKPKLKVDCSICFALYHDDSKEGIEKLLNLAVCNVNIVNIGYVPIQIESCAIKLGETGIGIESFNNITIVSGEKRTEHTPLTEDFLDLIEDKANAKVDSSVYIEIRTPYQLFNEKIKLNYGEFMYECRRKAMQNGTTEKSDNCIEL